MGHLPRNVLLVHIYLSLATMIALRRLILLFCLFPIGLLHAQLLSWTPPFPVENDPAQTLVITMDASKGNRGLFNYNPQNDVYVHIGVITNKSTSPTDWKYVKFSWGTTNSAAATTYAGNQQWRYTINGSLRSFFGITDPTESIMRISILFRNGAGTLVQRNSDNSDMYIPVYGTTLAVRLDQPPMQPKFVPEPEPVNLTVGSNFTLTARSNKAATITLFHNGVQLQSATGVQALTATTTITSAGTQVLVAQANDGSNTSSDTVRFFVAPPANVQPLPAGVRDGINYEPGDTSAILVLRAPGKNRVSVIGEFNNWTQQVNTTMSRTPDGKFFWLRLHPLSPGVEYAYQYVVDDSIKIADPYAEKILDPWNDRFISSTTYPNLKPYPAGQSGIVSVLQTRKPSYSWSNNSFARPDKRGLVIYEMLLRDFVAAHDWKTLSDSLGYLKNLGINAIELLPFNEFEGNESWGYNPDFYFAPDKYYGTEVSLKRFIDSAHAKGIAVIMDIALNHSFGLSPMVQLYWNSAQQRPAINNPWYNPAPKHAFNVGYDFNHESPDTKYFVGRVLEHWVKEYKIDGFRFDLSKGFTQKQTCDDNGNNCNVAAMGAYDASRVAILKGYYDTLQNKAAGTYAIMEHFADNSEEIVLADYGMLLWGNMNHAYAEGAMGYVQNSNLEGGLYQARGWSKPHLVTYAESHDEERIVYKTLNFGAASGNYNTRDTATALKRMELDAAFLFTIPGPKMFWQFGELGYHFSINRCPDGSINNDCRLANKPLPWAWLSDPKRKSVYDTYARLIKLRFHPLYREVFMTGNVERSLSGAFKWLVLRSAQDSSDLVVVGNFDLTTQTGNVNFPTAGTWYDVFNNTTLSAVAGTPQAFSLQPGEFRVYANRNVNNIAITPVVNVPSGDNEFYARVYPNPVRSSFVVDANFTSTGEVAIVLYDMQGKNLGTLYRGMQAKGRRQISLQRPALPAGSYLLQLTTTDQNQTITLQF